MSNLFERINAHKLEHNALSIEMIVFVERQIELTKKSYKHVFGRDTNMYDYDYLMSDNELHFVGCMKYGRQYDGGDDWCSATICVHPLIVVGKDDEYFEFCIANYTDQKEKDVSYVKTHRLARIKQLVDGL